MKKISNLATEFRCDDIILVDYKFGIQLLHTTTVASEFCLPWLVESGDGGDKQCRNIDAIEEKLCTSSSESGLS